MYLMSADFHLITAFQYIGMAGSHSRQHPEDAVPLKLD